MGAFKQGVDIQRLTSTVTTGGTTLLVYNSTEEQEFTGTSNHTVQLPDGLTMKAGQKIEIINKSSGMLTVNNGAGAFLMTVGPGSQSRFRITNVASTAGSWDKSVGASGGGSGVTAGEYLTIGATKAGGNSELARLLTLNPEEIGRNYWISRSSLPTAKAPYGNSLSFNGYLYAPGGYNGADITENARYDDDNNYWLVRTPLTIAKTAAGCFSVGGSGYVIAGGLGGFYTTAHKLNDATDTWSALNAFPVGMYELVGVATQERAYVTGGYDGTTRAYVYAYNATADAWYLRTPMITTRFGHATFALEGHIYACGGNDGVGNTALSERHSEVTDTWKAITSLNTGVSNTIGYAQNGMGYTVSGNGPSALNQQYSHMSDFWKNRKPLTTARGTAGGNSVNGSGYAFGGESYLSSTESYKDASIFNLGRFKSITGVPSKIFVSAQLRSVIVECPVQVRTDGDNWKTLVANRDSALKPNELYKYKFSECGLPFNVGGYTSGYTPSAINEAYNATVDAWISKLAVTVAAYSPATFGLNGKGYLNGGFNGAALDTNYQYDEVTNTWATKAPYAFGASNTTSGDYLYGFGYVVGGGGSFISTAKYNDTLDSWVSAADSNSNRALAAVGALHERLIATGGGSNNTESYNPITNVWTNKAATGVVNHSFAAGVVCRGNFYATGSSSAFSPVIDQYDDQTDAFTAKASRPSNAIGTGTFRQQGYIHFFGGELAGPSHQTQHSQYNIEQDAHITRAALGTARSGMPSQFTPGVQRHYELRILLPSFVAGLGAGAWVSGSTQTAVLNCMASNMGGFGYALDSVTGFVKKHIETTDVFLNKGASLLSAFGYTTRFTLLGFSYCGMPNSGTGSIRREFERLDPVLETNITRTSSPTGHGIGAGFALSGYGYVNGGNDPSPIASADRYDPITDSWTAITSLTNSREGGSGGGSVGGFGYAIASQTSGGSENSEKYHDVQNVWTMIAPHPTASSAYVSTCGFNEFLHTNGGSGSTDCYKYSGDTNMWMRMPSLNVVAAAAASVVANNTLCVFPGTNNVTQKFADSRNKLVAGVNISIQ